MLAASHVSDQLDLGYESLHGEEEEREVDQRVPANTMAPEAPCVLVKEENTQWCCNMSDGSQNSSGGCSDPLTYRHTLSQLFFSNYWYG